MIVVDAEFSATWSSPGDFLARVGLGFNSTQTPSQRDSCGIVRVALETAIRALIVIRAIAVIFPIRLVVFVLIAHEIG